MTTIIGRKFNGNIELFGDKRTVFGNGRFSDNAIKIINLDNSILIGTAGDAIDIQLIQELYKDYKKDNGKIQTILDAIKFTNHIKSNCNISENLGVNTAFIIMNKNFQIIIENTGQITNLNDSSNGYLVLGSGGNIANTIIDTLNYCNKDYEISDIFKIVSSIDPFTSEKFDNLSILSN